MQQSIYRLAARALLTAFALALPLSALGQTVVTMWTFLDPAKTTGREVALKGMIDSFEKANPTIRIKVEPQVFSQLMSKFLAGHNTGSAPDIIWVNTENMGALVKSGAAADLNDLFLKGWTKDQDADFFVRAGWDATLVNGKRYAVPLFHATTSLFYRKDLFKEAGVDPASIKTWDDLVEAAKKLTRDADKDGRVDVWGFGTPLSTERTGGTTAFTTMLVAAGKVWDNCKPNYANDAGVRAVQLHVDMINKYKVMPKEAIANNVDDVVDQFVAGRYAIATMPFARYAQVGKQAKWGADNLGVLPWPAWTADKVGPQQVQGWWAAVWSRSKNAKEAGAFVEWMISRDSVHEWAVTGGQVPTRTSVWKEPALRDPKFDYMKAVVDGWAANSFLVPTECNTARFDADWNQAVQRVIVGGKTPKEAMQEAEKAFLSRQ
jgi:multiple sugar transport system substrate-binding protein